MDWKLALKICGPSIIAPWLFHALIVRYLGSSEVFKTNLYLNVLLIVVIFSFCSFMGWLWVQNDRRSDASSGSVEKNEITGNEVGSNMEIGSKSSDVKKNKIKENKVDGNIKIG